MTLVGSSPIWSDGMAAALANRSVVFFGAGLTAANALAAAGADVRAAVYVAAEGATPIATSFPVYVVQTETRSRTNLQVPIFPDVLEARAHDVLAFLAEHDRDEHAVVLAGLPVPPAAIAGRTSWTVDAALARTLEEKRPGHGPLDGVLPWVSSEPVPAQVDEPWWREITARLGTARLVVQALGLNCGGDRTWLCAAVDDVRRAVASGGASRVSGYIDGVSVNVMGCVGADGAVMIMPPSRQLCAHLHGRPLHAGNIFEGIAGETGAPLIDDARLAGKALAERGYVGTFGLDGIVDGSGQCHYHDLNARVNGVVHAFNLLLPAMSGLLLAPGWLGPDGVQPAEHEASRLVVDRPIARWALMEEPAEPICVRVPKAGLYRVDPVAGRAWYVDAVDQPDAVDGDVVLVRQSCQSGWSARAGELVDVADLWCAAAVATALERRWDGAAMSTLLDAVRTASDG